MTEQTPDPPDPPDPLVAYIAEAIRINFEDDPWLEARGLTVPDSTITAVAERAALVARNFDAGLYEE